MISREQNAMLTAVGPGTPMHAALERYWMPVAMSSEITGRDTDPLRVTVLGDDYVLFRDTGGNLGLLREHCCHRSASLVLGRVEDGGIRCLFHGWKYAVDGRALEMPNCDDPAVLARIRQPSYPVREAGGLIWAYLGPPQHEPPFPMLPFFDVPESHRYVVAPVANANFVQMLEGLLDSTHVGILHSDPLNRALNPMLGPGSNSFLQRQMLTARTPRIVTKDTDFGFWCVAIREEQQDERPVTIARISAFAMPCFGFIASGWTMVAAVPNTDTRTTFYHVFWDTKTPLVGEQLDRLREFYGFSDRALYDWGLAASARDLPTAASRENNFHQDRAAMRRGETFTGILNFVPEDIAMAESQGSICDRSGENLIAADAGVARMRRMLLEAGRSVQAGNAPPGLRPREKPMGIQGPVASVEDWPSLLDGQLERAHVD